MTEADTTNLSQLKRDRATIKGQVTRIQNFFAGFNPTTNDRAEVEARLQKIEEIWNLYEDIQSKIESIDESDEQVREREAFETSYYRATAAAKRILAPPSTTNNRGTIGRGAGNIQLRQDDGEQTMSNVKLPSLNLPKFDGSYAQWLSFRDTFQALIDECNSLSDIQKFYYLRSSLQGVASQVINSLETTAANYTVAWDLLKARFENKRLMLHHHVQSLFETTSIQKESASQLRKLVDDSLKHLRALKTLGQPTENWDCLMVYLLSSKLDSVTRRKWESSITSNTPPTFTQLTDFLTQYCSILETLQPSKSTTNKAQGERKEKKLEQTTSCTTTKSSSKSCIVCKGEHSIYNCSTFKDLSTESRLNEVKRSKLCFNCLRDNHTAEKCMAGGCKRCGRKHNTLLHFDDSPSKGNDDKSSAERSTTNSENRGSCSNDQSDNVALSHYAIKQRPQVLLSTAQVKIYDKSGNPHTCRALLDSGSQSNLITNELCKKLQLTKHETNISLSGVSLNSSRITNSTHATIKSRVNEFKTKLSFLVLEQITERLPTSRINIHQIALPRDVVLADPAFHTPGQIDLLLGAGVFWGLLCVGQLRISNSQLILQKTKLGWVISGNIPLSEAKSEIIQPVVCGFASDQELERQVERFWKIEEYAPDKKLSKEEQICEDDFKRTHQRDQNGRFSVSLSFRGSINQLGDSRNIALKRLQAVNRRLNREPELREQYKTFLDEYLTLGHMTEVRDTENQNENFCHYIPHHAVLKESSTTTKLRVVFDASCKTSTNTSLNDILRVGPTIQQDLFSIVARFRKHQYVITADVTKMYRQVNLQEDQRDVQRILWQPESDHSIKEYRLNTVTYGLAIAPFLAFRCLHQLAYDNEDEYPLMCNIIRNDFYVDDLLTGADTIDEIQSIKREVSQILLTGGFPLRKWTSNTTVIIDDEFENGSGVERPIGEEVKTLGLYWNPADDVFRYKVNVSETSKRATKRYLLSLISQIYDPLGLVGPACIKAKIILQHLWRLKIGWDESLPADLHTMWIQYYSQLATITNISIPRVVVCANPSRIELHGFCDASESAYGACVFIKSIKNDGVTLVRLHSAKSRVAPLKVVTLPRLELCGALLLAQLVRKVTEALDLPIDEKHYWSDSQVALAWIAGEPAQWKTFVANRVAEIQQLTDKDQWQHVRSQDNPADIISRGINPEKLENLQLWWDGPRWLSQSNEECVGDSELQSDETANLILIEQVESTPVLNIIIKNFDLLERYSSLSKLKRIMAYCLRFINNAKRKKGIDDNKSTKPVTIRDVLAPTVQELDRSMMSILKLSQARDFQRELQDLSAKRNLHASSKLSSLNPFIDEAGLIRVGGRLQHAPLPYTRRFPIVLASNSHITTLIIRSEHLRNLHAGPQALLSSLGERYWILCARSTVRKVLHACITCFRQSATSPGQLMGNLPEVRVTPSRAFLNVGVDYGGPFSIKVSRNKTAKAYLCLFICLATRAVHLELVTDLSTAAFLNALKRFIARRGKCANIYSDNGSNFAGANNELKALANLLQTKDHDQRVTDYLSVQSIQWHFIPPYSPHMGGIWEAGIKSAKTHLKRVLGNALLTFEEFYTILTEIEACLNSRPISPMSSDPNDLTALTPGHFLIGSSLTAISQPDLQDVASNRVTHYQLLTKLQQHFWARWSREYLSQLQARNKWKIIDINDKLKPGTLVILRDEKTPPLQWKRGRITETHPGRDGLIRVVSIKTTNGIVQRSLPKICIMPIAD